MGFIMNASSLRLYEQVYLLSVQNHNGKPHDYSTLMRQQYAMAGAALMELMTNGHIRFDESQRCIPARETTPPDDLVLSAALERIRKAKKPHDAKYWVQMIHAYFLPYGKALRNLVEKGVIRLDRETKWKIFPIKRYSVERPEIKDDIVQRLEEAIRTTPHNAKTPNATNDDERTRDIILLGLVRSAGLIPYVFPARAATDKEALESDVETALRRKPTFNAADEALEEAEKRKERALEAIEISLEVIDNLTFALDAIADAVDASADAGGGDGGGDD
jgi:hypothetical protein